jgi:hypothetical protein
MRKREKQKMHKLSPDRSEIRDRVIRGVGAQMRVERRNARCRKEGLR